MIKNELYAARLLRECGEEITSEEVQELIDAVADLGPLAEAIYELGPPFNGREAQVLAAAAGDMDEDHCFGKDGDMWRDDILEKYAAYVHNYEYTYNDEALKVDPNIDTSMVHIGPMAQDLEQVNPATVIEDPKSGYKTVDTGRLALMNAGAIADLARQVKEIRENG